MRSTGHRKLYVVASRICTESPGYTVSASLPGCSSWSHVHSIGCSIRRSTLAVHDWLGLSQQRRSSSLESSQGSTGSSSIRSNTASGSSSSDASGSGYEHQAEPASQQDPASSTGRDNAYRRGFGAKVALPAKDVLHELLVDQPATFKLRAYHLGQRIHIGRVQQRASILGCRTNSGKDYCIIWLTPNLMVQGIRTGQPCPGANASLATAKDVFTTILQLRLQNMVWSSDSRQEQGVHENFPWTNASGAAVVPFMLVVYRYGSVVFTGTPGDLEPGLVDLLVPRQLRYKAGGQSDAWMMQAPMMCGIWLPQEEQTVVVKPDAAHPAVKGVDKIELRVLDVGSVRVLTSVLGQSAALKFYETSVGDAVDKLLQWRARKRRAAGYTRNWSLGVFGTSQEQTTMFKVFAASALITVEARELLEMAEPAWQYDAYHSIWSLTADEFELEKRFRALETKLQQVEKEAKHDVKQREGRKYQRLEQFVILLLVVSCMIAFLELIRELLSSSTGTDQQGVAPDAAAAGLRVDEGSLADAAAEDVVQHLQQQGEEGSAAAAAGPADDNLDNEHFDGPAKSILVSVASSVAHTGADWTDSDSLSNEAGSADSERQSSSSGGSQKARSRWLPWWPWRRT